MPTERELEQMRDANIRGALEGKDMSGPAAVYDLVTGEDPGPQPQD